MYADVVSLSASVFGDQVKQTNQCINQGNGIKLLQANEWIQKETSAAPVNSGTKNSRSVM